MKTDNEDTTQHQEHEPVKEIPKPLPPHIQEYNKKFLESHAVMIAQWRRKHPRQHPPIFKDKEGRYIWANRKMRRRAASRKNKK